jgi:hypothetical protein
MALEEGIYFFVGKTPTQLYSSPTQDSHHSKNNWDIYKDSKLTKLVGTAISHTIAVKQEKNAFTNFVNMAINHKKHGKFNTQYSVNIAGQQAEELADFGGTVTGADPNNRKYRRTFSATQVSYDNKHRVVKVRLTGQAAPA